MLSPHFLFVNKNVSDFSFLWTKPTTNDNFWIWIIDTKNKKSRVLLSLVIALLSTQNSLVQLWFVNIQLFYVALHIPVRKIHFTNGSYFYGIKWEEQKWECVWLVCYQHKRKSLKLWSLKKKLTFVKWILNSW